MTFRNLASVLIIFTALLLFIGAKFYFKSKRREVFINGKVLPILKDIILFRKLLLLVFSIRMQTVVVEVKKYSGEPFREYRNLLSN